MCVWYFFFFLQFLTFIYSYLKSQLSHYYTQNKIKVYFNRFYQKFQPFQKKNYKKIPAFSNRRLFYSENYKDNHVFVIHRRAIDLSPIQPNTVATGYGFRPSVISAFYRFAAF